MKTKKLAPVGPTVTVADIKAKIASDPQFPPSRRGSALSSVNMLPKWANSLFRPVPDLRLETMAFNKRNIEALFDDLTPVIAGTSRKRIQNAKADCRFVMERYGQNRERLRVPLSLALKAETAHLNKFKRMGLAKLLVYHSVHNLDPKEMDDARAGDFCKWVEASGVKHAERVWRRAIKLWNETRDSTGWPEITLAVPSRRQLWGRRWEAFPSSLERAVDAFFARGDKVSSLFSSTAPTADPLADTTVTGQKECVRWAASALVRSGLQPDDIASLRDVCSPEPYRRALEQLVHQKGYANSTIGLVAYVLTKMAKYSGALSDDEIEEVKTAHTCVQRAVKHHMRDHEDRDQKLLNQLDDPKVLDALLTLARDTVRRVLASGGKTYRDAIKIQMALILEIWLCAPIRLSNMCRLRLDQHFFRTTFDGAGYVEIRISGAEVKNRKEVRHFLTLDAVDLLELYLDEFLPIITKNNASAWLFPGRQGRTKDARVLRMQANKFVREGTGLRFHPHAIRKITTKIYLDQDPGGIEVMRRTLGDTEETTRGVYTQHVHRASQRQYVGALESRRLMSSSQLIRRKRKGSSQHATSQDMPLPARMADVGERGAKEGE